jgi:hypothetical protein
MMLWLALIFGKAESVTYFNCVKVTQYRFFGKKYFLAKPSIFKQEQL